MKVCSGLKVHPLSLRLVKGSPSRKSPAQGHTQRGGQDGSWAAPGDPLTPIASWHVPDACSCTETHMVMETPF